MESPCTMPPAHENRRTVRTGCMLADYVFFRCRGRGTGRFHVGAGARGYYWQVAIIGELQAPETDKDEEDWKSYIAFCEFIAPCVLWNKMNYRAASDIGPRNVKKGLLSVPSYDTLQTWTTWNKTGTEQNDIAVSYASRTQGPDQEKISVYCKPRLLFRSQEAIKGFGHDKDNNHFNPCHD